MFDITVGDKIKFVYSYDHNVVAAGCGAYARSYSGGSEATLAAARRRRKSDGQFIYEAVVTEPARSTSRASSASTATTARRS